MKFILGRKVNMTQVFDENGVVHPATVVEATPIVVTQVKTAATDGYAAVQVGSGARRADLINKPLRGHIKELGNFSDIREFRFETEADLTAAAKAVGDKIDLTQFKVGDVIEVSAISKGKGFQGVVKRHGFHGGPRSHGQKHSEREPGSIGGGLRNKVPKKMRMAGRMGGDRITVKNLTVLHIDAATNSLYISGAVPGRRGTLVEITG
ncbi:MAG: rplC [Candidatus Taylorbacteria bacterium]|nr:rplC [Candidatus Taylorbacteria bacterium]